MASKRTGEQKFCSPDLFCALPLEGAAQSYGPASVARIAHSGCGGKLFSLAGTIQLTTPYACGILGAAVRLV